MRFSRTNSSITAENGKGRKESNVYVQRRKTLKMSCSHTNSCNTVENGKRQKESKVYVKTLTAHEMSCYP